MSLPATMEAAVFHGPGDIRLTEVPVPTPGKDELLIRVAAVGVCGTDAHEFAAGPHMFPTGPFIPGHEFAGDVVAAGRSVVGFALGDLVASGAGVSCGQCPWCARGATNLCLRYETVGLQRQGALAEYVIAPATICMGVGAQGLTADVAALAQPMAIAVHAMRRGRVDADDRAVIIGAGSIGAFLTYAVSAANVETIVLDLDEERLQLATRLGASQTQVPQDGFGVDGATVIYEATGSRAGLSLAFDLASPGARIVLVGIQDEPSETAFRDVTLGELELIGTNAHVFSQDFPEAVRLLSSRNEGWDDLAPTAFPLRDVVSEGLLPLVEGRPTRIKTLIDPRTSETRTTR